VIPEHGWPLVTAERMRTLDRTTIEEQGVPGELLMESAGRAVADEVLALRADRGGRVLVVAGGGNNGGDGLVTARHLVHLGVPVEVWLCADEPRLSGDAKVQLARLRRIDGTVHPDAPVGPFGVVVDALFGTGLSRPLEGRAVGAVDAVAGWRAAGARVLAVDLPSGIDADTGAVLGTAVRADRTAALSLPKLGHAMEPGRSHCGDTVVLRIGIADHRPGERDDGPDARLWTARVAARALPARPEAGHKGVFGHVLVAAGSRGMTGAAGLAARAAARAGAGLVTVAGPAQLQELLAAQSKEAMTVAVSGSGDHLEAASADALLALAAERSTLVLGPGIGRAESTSTCARTVATRAEVPLVLDADGLFAFGDEPEPLAARPAATVLTPHPGEAARLLGTDTASLGRDRVSAARRLAERSGAVVVLKGAATVVADPEGRVRVNPTGGPLLATGGTGDVLAGVIGGLLAQGLPALEAATLGTFLHGAAADGLAGRLGDAGLLASELADALPETARRLAERAAAAPGPGLAIPFPEP